MSLDVLCPLGAKNLPLWVTGPEELRIFSLLRSPCHSSDFCINRQPLLVFWLIAMIWFSFTFFRIHFGFKNHYWVVNVCASLFRERWLASRWCQGHCLAPPGGVCAVLHMATLLGAFKAECDDNCVFHGTSRVLSQVYFNPFRSSSRLFQFYKQKLMFWVIL